MKLTGYEVVGVEALWVACARCPADRVVYGSTADVQAQQWAAEHERENHLSERPGEPRG